MADDAINQDLPHDGSLLQPLASPEAEQSAAELELPHRLRVHSLARVLGTTSKRVIDALNVLDGRIRSVHSSVDQADALRVRDLLAAEASTEAPPATPAGSEQEATPAIESAPETEPESRLILETPDSSVAVEHPTYLPLFQAPEPVSTYTVTYPDSDYPAAVFAAPVFAHGDDDGADADGDDSEDTDSDDESAERPTNRRRRRGRRGRGRGRGEQATDAEESDGDTDGEAGSADDDASERAEESESDDDDDDGDDETTNGEGATRRRRRRRRRKAGGDSGNDVGAADDPPNTVVHERAPRAKADRSEEIQGITGSTRLEAKRQRRRDGRDAGRRRPPILTEAEFLARREAVDRVMVVRDKIRTEPPHQGARYTQIAVLEDGIVVEHFVTSAASASLVGNIYLGIVQNVLPSMEAAFVDIGRGRNGVLYAGEVNWEAAGLGGSNRKIEQALKPGDYVVVQVSKDPVGHKGARLTTQISLAGRYLVYVPGASSTGISRKLPDTERQRLKDLLREIVPADAGVIIRTASEGVKEEDIRADVDRLQERWTGIAEKAEDVKAKRAGAAVALYEEPDVLVKVIRDLFNEDFSGLTVSGDDAWETITGYVGSVAPELVSKLTKYENDGGPDVFAVHRIDEQLAKAMDRKVWLPSGGTLVIDRTEAMTVVDVNTGKFTGAGGNLEQTVTKNNLEAAEEIVRQLRLRDIGGIVVIDFIDMVLESNRDLVLRRLTEALARDRTRHQVSEVTSLGLVQLTRKRLGTGLVEAFSTTCAECAGRGIVLHADPIDSAPAGNRGKAETSASASASGGRRNRRGRKLRTEEPVAEVAARVPVHAPGEHPMFKAMAAAKGDDESEFEETEFEDAVSADVVEETVTDKLAEELSEDDDDLDEVEDLDEDDEDDEDDDEDDELDDDEEDDDDDEDDEDDDDDDELDDDEDDDDEDEDDDDVELDEDEDDDDVELDEVDEDVIDDDAIEEDESLEIVGEDDGELDDSDADDVIAEVAPPPTILGRLRRRAAVRPAGPPAGDG